MNKYITKVTRRSIVDHIIAEDISWSGRLPEDEFLSRLYDLTTIPITDCRMYTADADIHQYRIHWNDWENDWVFYDPWFNLIRASDETFLQFLCETIHPVACPYSHGTRRLVSAYNRHLAIDGWQLVELSQISGRQVFQPQQATCERRYSQIQPVGRKSIGNFRRCIFGSMKRKLKSNFRWWVCCVVRP